MTAHRRAVAAGPARRPVTCEVWWAGPWPHHELLPLLDTGERRRAARLRRTEDRDRFVTARALLRLVLHDRTGTAPAQLRLDVTCPRCGREHGKPRLIEGERSASFSIAHAAGRIAIAVTDGVPVGVDVEVSGARPAVDLTDLATDILSTAELGDYHRIEPTRRARALAVWWTRKESVLKATGDGLRVPLHQLVVTAPDRPAALRETRGDARPAMVTLHDLTPGEGFVGCVAALGVRSLAVSTHDGDARLARARAARSPVAGVPQ